MIHSFLFDRSERATSQVGLRETHMLEHCLFPGFGCSSKTWPRGRAMERRLPHERKRNEAHNVQQLTQAPGPDTATCGTIVHSTAGSMLRGAKGYIAAVLGGITNRIWDFFHMWEPSHHECFALLHGPLRSSKLQQTEPSRAKYRRRTCMHSRTLPVRKGPFGRDCE